MRCLSVERATAHRFIAAVSRLVVERGIAVDQAVCIPVKGLKSSSADTQELPERDAGTVEFNAMHTRSRIGLLLREWWIEGYGFMVGMRFHGYNGS